MTSSDDPHPDLITVCFMAPVDALIKDFIALSLLLRRWPELRMNPDSPLSLPNRDRNNPNYNMVSHTLTHDPSVYHVWESFLYLCIWLGKLKLQNSLTSDLKVENYVNFNLSRIWLPLANDFCTLPCPTKAKIVSSFLQNRQCLVNKPTNCINTCKAKFSYIFQCSRKIHWHNKENRNSICWNVNY